MTYEEYKKKKQGSYDLSTQESANGLTTYQSHKAKKGLSTGSIFDDVRPRSDSSQAVVASDSTPNTNNPVSYISKEKSGNSVESLVSQVSENGKLDYTQKKFVSTYTPILAAKTMPGQNYSILGEVQFVSAMEDGEEKEKRKKELLKEMKSCINDYRKQTLLQPLDDGWHKGDIISIAMEGLDRLSTIDKLNENDLYSFLTGEIRDADFWDLTLNSITRGYNNSRYGEESFKAMNGGANEKDEYEKILNGDTYRFEPNNEFESGVAGAFQQVGQQIRQWTNPRTLAIAGGAAGTAAIAGQAGPQALVPEEILTVPAAFAAGIAAGSAGSSLEIEAGLAYNEMLEAGVSEKTARKVALTVGTVNAGLEALQVDELIDAYQITKATGATKSFTKRIIDELFKRGIDVALETGEEVAQEGVTIAGTQIGSKIDNGEWAYSMEDVTDRLWDTTKSSALSFGMLNVPAASKNIISNTNNSVKMNDSQGAAGTQNTQRNGTGAQGSGSNAQSAFDTYEDILARGTNAAADPLSAAVDAFKANNTISNKQATEILNNSKALQTLRDKVGLELPETAAGRRNAIKKAVAKLVEQSAVDVNKQSNKPSSDPVNEHISMEDFANQGSPVWRNVKYGDDSTKASIMQDTHNAMVAEGSVVKVADDVTDSVDQAYPDLRSMKKKERTPILKNAMNKLKSDLRQFLNGFKNQSFEFEVNGKILDATLYNTGINEVLEKVTKQKANMLYSTEDIFRNARYLYSTPDYDGNPNVYRWNYFYTPVQIGQEVVGVRIAVRDMVKGTDGSTPESQIYNWGIKKDASLDGGSHNPRAASSDVSSDASINNISEVEPDVNTVSGKSTSQVVDTETQAEYDNENDAPVYKPYHPGQDIQEFDHTLWEERKAKTASEYGLSEVESESIDSYVGGSAYEWNSVLRGDENYEATAYYDYWIQQATAALKKIPQFEGRTYRNLTFNSQDILNKFLAKHERGKTVTADSFLSSSKDPNGYVVSGDYVVHMVIDGISGRDISETFSIPGQQEVVYIPGTTLYITAVQIANDGNPLIYAKEVIDNGKNMETNTDGNGQSSSGANYEGQAGNAERKGHDLGRIYSDRRMEGNGGAGDARQVQQSGGSIGYGEIDNSDADSVAPANPSVGAADAGFDSNTHLQYQYGTLPSGENPVRSDDLPVSTNGTNRVSQTAVTVKGAKATPDNLVDLLNKDITTENGMTYIPITNDATVQKAYDRIVDEGWDAVKAQWHADVQTGKAGADLSATGALLLNNAANAGDKTAWLDILHDYQRLGTNTAQGLQALRILKKLAPSDKLYMAKRSVKQMVKDMKLDTEVTIDPALETEYNNAETDKQRDAVLKKIQKNVAQQLPTTFMEKFTALRYVNMLGNLRTQGRNIVGNLTMKATRSIHNTVATSIEAIANKVSGGKIGRTRSLTVNKDQKVAGAKDFDDLQGMILDGGKYSDNMTATGFARGVQEQKQIFKFKPLEGYRKVTNWMMETGDIIFAREAYARALAGYLKANGITETDLSKVDSKIMEDARLFAAKEAQEATFRDTNWLSGWVSKIGRRKDTPAVGKLISEGVMPFRKTPANVLVRAEEYSPLGVINSVVTSVKAAKKGSDVTANDVINSWAKTLTGTGIFGMGMLLQSLGLLSAGPDDDEDKNGFEDLNGWQDYALTLPDGTNLTIDCFSPTAIPLLMGAQLMKEIGDNGFELKDIESSLTSIADPLVEMSMLQGVNDSLENIQYADSNLGQFFINASLSYLTQGLTNTLFGQLERSFENSRMQTYVDKNSDLPAWLQRTLGKASAKTPVWDYNQIPYINAWGEEEENPGTALNLVYNLLSPSYFDKGKDDDLTRELNRLNDAQGERNVYPSIPDKSVTINKQEYNLSADEYVALAKKQGQSQRQLVENIIANSDYSILSDEDKAKAIGYAYEYARDSARGEVIEEHPGITTKWMTEIKGDVADAIIRHVATGTTDKYTSLSVSDASYVVDLLKGLLPEGGSNNVRTIQKVEAVAKADNKLSEAEQKKVLEDVLDDNAYAKYLKILALGQDTDDYAESYRIYLDTEGKGKKSRIVTQYQKDLGVSQDVAEKIYNIYAGKS